MTESIAWWGNDLRRKRLAEQVALSLMDHSPEFDIQGIVNEMVETEPDCRTLDSMPAQKYWSIVHNHDLLDPAKRVV